ncbi:MAG: phosphate starvation-inducible protein PhoH [Egibacteraceae bacterium]
MRRTAAVAVLDMDLRGPYEPLEHPSVRDLVERVDCYDLPALDLARYRGLVAEGMIDQEFLYRHRQLVADYLDRGGTVVFGGHLLRPWLPGAGIFVPKVITSFGDYQVRIVSDHPIFAGVDPHDLTYRRGVAGFFARGHNPPPDTAVVLAELAGGEPVVYLDERTTAGTILVHSGYGLLGYSPGETTAARVAPQLLAWISQR